MDPTSSLRCLQNESAANTVQARECAVFLHGWLSAGGKAPIWKRWPLGTARFLRKFPEHRRDVPSAEKYKSVARIILAHDPNFRGTDAAILRPGDLSDEATVRYRTGDLTNAEIEREIERHLR